MTSLIVVALLAVLILLALGIPIYLVLMGVASILLVAEGRTIAGLGQHVLDHLQSPILISVPFFILSAVLMQGGGLAKVLFDAALAWIGWVRGGLAIAGVAATAVFAAITGSSAATTMAMGTLLVPLMAMATLAKRIIAPGTAYVDLSYKQTLALSTAFQGGVVTWVAFWAFYGQGFGAMSSVMSFGAAYMTVVLLEPLVDLLVLAGAKSLRDLRSSGLFTTRLFDVA